MLHGFLLEVCCLHWCADWQACTHTVCDASVAAGQKNDDHFFVATQDKSMQRQCMAVPGGAVIFASVNGVHLEAPSALQQKQVKQVGWGQPCSLQRLLKRLAEEFL